MNTETEPALEPAIHYVPEAYQTLGPRLMGRNAAGESFMKAWLRHGAQRVFRARVENKDHAADFHATVQRLRPGASSDAVTPAELNRLSDAGLLFYPGPDVVQSAWQRALHGATRWSLCGVTHTTASAAAMDSITGWLAAPLHPWDAVICTSSVVLDTVKAVLQAQAEHLAGRLGATRVTLPLLPVIPLGVHTEEFEISLAQRATAREALGITPQVCVILYVGRLSFHAKAHPLAMYQALQAAAQRQAGGQRVLLIECGWYANEPIEQAFDDAARATMPDVQRLYIDGRDPAARERAWAAADVFCSLSDNIQETFGLTPVEAMAAGLPCVVSDWNGYKDTVRHGVDGIRVPTLAPPEGDGQDLARAHALGTLNYDHYCGQSSACVAVDVRACTEAFAALIGSPELRAQMGSAAKARARSVYDWRPVYAQYQALWQELVRRRVAMSATHRNPVHPWPARMDPFSAFRTYPSATIGDGTVFTLAASSVESALERLATLSQLGMVRPFTDGAAGLELARQMLGLCAASPTALQELCQSLPAVAPRRVRRRAAWLCKLGVLSAAPKEGPSA